MGEPSYRLQMVKKNRRQEDNKAGFLFERKTTLVVDNKRGSQFVIGNPLVPVNEYTLFFLYEPFL